MPELLAVPVVVPVAPADPDAVDAPVAPEDPEATNGRIPVEVPPAMISLAALWVAPFIAPAAVAKPPKPEYVCR